MSVAVQAPVSALNDQFKSLDLNFNVSRVGNSADKARKKQLSEDEKKKRIFDTPYEPSLEWWTANQAAYVKPEDDLLPAGFPEQVDSPTVWDGKVLINQPEKWLYRFTAEDIALLNAAYDHFTSLSLPYNDISRTTFPIPEDSNLYKALEKAVHDIKFGVGLRVLRGLPVDDWTRAKQIVIFAGVTAYFGPRRIKQGVQNIVHLRDITDLPVDNRPVITVKGQTSGNQVFHNDGSVGIVSLITVGVAETGGLSQLSSVARTYNELARTRRDVVRELAKADWKTKVFPDGKALWFSVNGKEVISSYGRRPFFAFYEADADVPPLATEKHLALDAVHFTAEQFSLDLDLQKGDLEYFNNLRIFHARTSSEDSKENARHLIRMWVENKDQPLPGDLREVFDRLNSGEANFWPEEAWDSVDPYASLTDAAKADVASAK